MAREYIGTARVTILRRETFDERLERIARACESILPASRAEVFLGEGREARKINRAFVRLLKARCAAALKYL